MSARAEAAEATRERIVDAATGLFLEHYYDEVTMRGIAAEAGVALQTVANHFATKENVFAAVIARTEEMHERPAEPDDVNGAVDMVIRDYEQSGDFIFRLLSLEERIPAMAPFLARGRREHRKWVAKTFPGALEGRDGSARERRLDVLVVATDVYTWKLLRRDRGLSKRATADAVTDLLNALYTNDRDGA